MKIYIPLLFVFLFSIISAESYSRSSNKNLSPAISNFSPSSGSIGTLITITGTSLDAATTVTVGVTPGIIISNSSNQLVAMVMTGTVSGNISINTSGGTATSLSNFTVVPSKVPNIQQGDKLLGVNNMAPSEAIGSSVSISADGNTAIVGGPNDNNTVPNHGAVWIFTRSGGTWDRQGTKLIVNGDTGPHFLYQGCSVSISADGNTAIVGARGDNAAHGAAWIFVRSGGVWSQQGNKLVGNDSFEPSNGGEEQGTSVSISADGNIALVGGQYDNHSKGATWVFIRSGATWSQQGSKLVGTGGVGNSYQGISVAVSADGNTAVIGGNGDNQVGAIWIFIRSAGSWIQQGNKLVGSGYVGFPAQGNSVAISADGNTVIEGGPSDNNPDGAAWIFTRSSGSWTQQGNKLVGTGSAGQPLQGKSVSLSADGNSAIVGAYYENGQQGAAWIYTRSQNSWSQQGNKIVGMGSVGPFVKQGNSVSLSADGNTAIVGGPGDNSDRGAAWIFSSGGTLPISFVDIKAIKVEAGNTITWKVADPHDAKTYTIQRSADGVVFTDIAVVNATNLSAYSFEDNNAGTATNYYRIKCLTTSSQILFSSIVSVNASSAIASLSIYPNPVINNKFTIQFANQKSGKYVVGLYSIEGNKILSQSINYNGSTQYFDFTIKNIIAKGVYTLRIVAPDNNVQTKTLNVGTSK